MRKIILFAVALFALVGVGSAIGASTPPQNTVAPSISGTARQGETLTADPGNWSGTTPITFTYQWRRCDSKGTSCANVFGATNKTYTLTSVDVGNTLRVRIRAANTAGARAVISAATGVIAAKAPKSVSLDTNQSVVRFGAAAMLTGSVSNGQAGEQVTIAEHLVQPVRGLQNRTAATVRTNSDGSFSVAVRPIARAQYKASTGETSSNTVSIFVRPKLRLSHIGLHRFQVRAFAARSFRGQFGVLQRWSTPRHRWIGVRRVFFGSSFFTGSNTIVSRATLRPRPGGVKIRVVLPRSQTAPWYLTGISNSATS